jgi:hypothetical protein
VLRQADVRDIIRSCEASSLEMQEEQEEEAVDKPKAVTATLHVYGPVFDRKAPNWRFLYKGKPIYADVKETSIARDAVNRGGSFVNDRYRVRMEVSRPNVQD